MFSFKILKIHLRFNTQPREGGCPILTLTLPRSSCFNTQPREGGCKPDIVGLIDTDMFQHTAARRRLLSSVDSFGSIQDVSTHSRAKAAANLLIEQLLNLMFQHTAARRRLREMKN